MKRWVSLLTIALFVVAMAMPMAAGAARAATAATVAMVPSGVPAATRVTPGPAGLVGPAGRVAARPTGARPMAARPLVPRGPAGRVVVVERPPTRRAASSVQGRAATLGRAPGVPAARARAVPRRAAAIPPSPRPLPARWVAPEPAWVGRLATLRVAVPARLAAQAATLQAAIAAIPPAATVATAAMAPAAPRRVGPVARARPGIAGTRPVA